ncbi:MAG TPA: YceI family protein [Rhodopila sp.]|nr:YceI family protein [Rhodopila sp.]
MVVATTFGAAALSPVSAQTASHDPEAVKAGDYAVEPGHSQVVFSILHMGFTYYWGTFSNVSGSLHIDPAHLAATKLNVTVPIDSVATTSTKLDGELKGPQWFDSGKYPTATFVSTKVSPTGKDTANITGNLTLHGVTRPETLTVHFIGAGVNVLDKKYTIGFEAHGVISRSEFGVKTYVPMVADSVSLTVAGAFELQGQ